MDKARSPSSEGIREDVGDPDIHLLPNAQLAPQFGCHMSPWGWIFLAASISWNVTEDDAKFCANRGIVFLRFRKVGNGGF